MERQIKEELKRSVKEKPNKCENKKNKEQKTMREKWGKKRSEGKMKQKRKKG